VERLATLVAGGAVLLDTDRPERPLDEITDTETLQGLPGDGDFRHGSRPSRGRRSRPGCGRGLAPPRPGSRQRLPAPLAHGPGAVPLDPDLHLVVALGAIPRVLALGALPGRFDDSLPASHKGLLSTRLSRRGFPLRCEPGGGGLGLP